MGTSSAVNIIAKIYNRESYAYCNINIFLFLWPHHLFPLFSLLFHPSISEFSLFSLLAGEDGAVSLCMDAGESEGDGGGCGGHG